MKIAVANPSVAPHVKQTVTACYEAGYLDYFYTSFFEHPDNRLSNSLKVLKPIRAEINRRSFAEIPINKFASRPMPELLRSIASRKLGPVMTDTIWEWAELGFDKWVASKLNTTIDAVYTCEHAALSTLKKATALGLFSIYEQPSQHHTFFNAIAEKQIELYPYLKTSATALLVNDKAKRRNKRRDEELAIASLIICNSTFTKNTLIQGGVNPEKISVIPLAFPKVNFLQKEPPVNRPVVFLYAGNQSLRKGSHILYEAWRLCNFNAADATLILVGKMALPAHLRQGLPGNVTMIDNIPHSELTELYGQADVFVLPTLADGFGMVVTEAMASGLPVITTENSCGPDIIEHMTDGWLIPAGNVQALVQQLKWCVANKSQLQGFGQLAQAKAKNWQWPQYREKLIEMIVLKWQQFREAKLSV